MTSPNLERLARSGELKVERFSRGEFNALLRKARGFLADARRPENSSDGRFSLAYAAAHALATAALRVQGYRSANRYLVFQCLEHSAGLAPAECRLFALCHERRNKSEYEGRFEVPEALFEAFLEATGALFERVSRMAQNVGRD